MTKNWSATRATTPPSKWAGATTSWSALRCVPATPGSVSVQFARVHSHRSSETSPMRARLPARRTSLRPSGRERIRSRVARSGSPDRDLGRTTRGAARYAARLLGNATSGTSTMAPPVIERSPTTLDGVGRTCSNPHACGRTFRRATWHEARRALRGAKSLWRRQSRSYHRQSQAPGRCRPARPECAAALPRQTTRTNRQESISRSPLKFAP